MLIALKFVLLEMYDIYMLLDGVTMQQLKTPRTLDTETAYISFYFQLKPYHLLFIFSLLQDDTEFF